MTHVTARSRTLTLCIITFSIQRLTNEPKNHLCVVMDGYEHIWPTSLRFAATRHVLSSQITVSHAGINPIACGYIKPINYHESLHQEWTKHIHEGHTGWLMRRKWKLYLWRTNLLSSLSAAVCLLSLQTSRTGLWARWGWGEPGLDEGSSC